MRLLLQILFFLLTCFTNHTIAGQKKYFDPFDVVIIYSIDAYQRDYISFDANSVNVLPAFYFPALQSSLNNKNLASTLKVTGGIVMVGVSVASMGTAATPLAALLDFTEALASTYILISTEGSFLTEISAEYGSNSWQYQTASKVNTFFEVYLLCRFGYAALGPLRSLALEIKNISASDVSFFQSNYPKFYERLLSVRNKAGEVLSGGSGAGNAFRGITKTQFFETVAEFKNPANGLLGDQAWDLWKAKNWNALEDLFKTNNINGKWPPNRGFIEFTTEPLTVGKEIDRYGGYIDPADGLFKDNGLYASPKGASFESRALPADYLTSIPPKPYNKYRVIKEIPNVKQGQAAPWFNQPGMGTQYELPLSIDKLLSEGFIIKIN